MYVDNRIDLTTADRVMVVRTVKTNERGKYFCPFIIKNGAITLSSAKKKKYDGKVDLLDIYNSLKGTEPYLFNPPEINKEKMIMRMAPLLYLYPTIRESIIKLYNEEPQRYYATAIRSKEYYNGVLNDGHLLYDVAVKRIYSVLLSAETDDKLRERVCNILYLYSPHCREDIGSLSTKLLEYLDDEKNSNAFAHICLYLLLEQYGVINDPLFNIIAYAVTGTDMAVEAQDYQARDYNILDNPFEMLDIDSNYTWKIIKEISNNDDISSIMRTFEKSYGLTDLPPTNRKIDELISNCKSTPCMQGLYRSANLLSCFGMMANKYGISTIKLLEGISIDRKRRNEMLTEYCRFYMQVSAMNTEAAKPVLSLDAYIAMSIICILLQHIVDSKKVFFENNNETMYSTVTALQEKLSEQKNVIQELEADKSIGEKTIESLKEQIHILSQSESKELKELIRPYNEENLALKHRIRELEDRLKQEAGKNVELNTLRSFAFDIQREYVPTQSGKDLHELVEGKKIVVIGGHINWRNHLKKEYPAFQIYDGGTNTADLSALQSADFVFLNVSNMSHALYYKAMNILRNCNVPFDFLGRVANQNLCEEEMANILLQHCLANS